MILEYLIIAAGAMIFVGFMITLLGATLHEVRHLRSEQAYRRHPRARRFRKRPLVTVIVRAQNDQPSIEQCLNSLRTGSYRKLEIILVDANSHDDTRRIARNFAKKYPRLRMRVYNQRSIAGFAKSAATAFLRAGHGEMVLVCKATDHFERPAIAQAVRQYQQASAKRAVLLDARQSTGQTMTSLLHRYWLLIVRRQHKVEDAFGALSVGLQDGVLYDASMFETLRRTSSLRLPALFAAQSVITSTATLGLRRLATLQQQQFYDRYNSSPRRISHSHTKMRLAWGKLIYLAEVAWLTVRIIMPGLLFYCIYLAQGLHQPTLLAVVVTFLAIYITHAVWSDMHMNVRRKLGYTLGLPVTYGYAFVWLCASGLFIVLAGLLPPASFRRIVGYV